MATAVTVLGALVLLLALRARWNPGDLDPNTEGCLTANLCGFLMALLHRLSYPRVLALCAPTVVAEYLACAYAAGGALAAGMVGIHLVVMGAVGLALALRDTPPKPAPSPEKAPRGPRVPRPASAHSV